MNTWNIDTTHSSIEFSVRHMVFAKVKGRFGAFGGTLEGDPKNLSQLKVHVDIETASIETGVADRDTHLRSADFFDVETHPKTTFVSTGVLGASGSKFQLTGDLTLHGVTKSVTLDAEFGGQAKDPWGNQRVAFSGSTSVDRTDFGLKWNQALEAGGVLVGDKIEISIDVQAIAAA